MKYADITAVILAGGRSSRMGGEDKGLLDFQGKAMIEHVIEVLQQRVDKVLINANRNLERYRLFGYPLISDATRDHHGPLAGFLAAMQAATTPEVLIVPCDSPLLCTELIERLVTEKNRSGAEIAVAHDGHRLQPVYALLSVSLKDSLRDYLAGGERKIDRWFPQHNMATVDCSDISQVFANINTPQELAQLEQDRNSA